MKVKENISFSDDDLDLILMALYQYEIICIAESDIMESELTLVRELIHKIVNNLGIEDKENINI